MARGPKPRISPAVKKKLVDLEGTGKFELKDLLDGEYSARTHYRAKRQMKAQGGGLPLPGRSSGRPSKGGDAVKDWIVELVRQQPSVYLKEIVALLDRYLGIHVAESTVGRWLRARNITHKKLSLKAQQRDRIRRRAYRLTMVQFRPDQLVFADETHTNQRTAWRMYGYAERKDRAVMYQDLNRGTKFTLLPALTLDGIIAPFVVPGSIDRERFEYWVEHFLLKHMNPFPGKNSVLVIDNASVHKGQRLVDMLHAKGCVLVFLPPYSPDFNPIENAFGTIKTAMRRTEAPGQWAVLKAALSLGPAHAYSFFRSCGYAAADDLAC